MPTPSKASTEVDLAHLFSTVAQTLTGSQERLNSMDGYNGDHGTNMVDIFQIAAAALSKQQGKPPEKALGYAAKQVRKLPSGSAQVYATGFENAAAQFKGQSTLGANDVSNLLTTLLGLGGSAQAAPQPTPQADPLAAFLGTLTGDTAERPTADEDTLLENLLEGGMAFLQAKQQGQDDMAAGLQALITASPLGEVPHRQESASLVVTGLLNALPGMLGQQ